MFEANSLSLNYDIINDFAKDVSVKTNIKSLFNIDPIIKSLGGNINFVNDYENNHFVTIFGKNNFNVNLMNGLSDDFKRVLLIQSIGHYLIHSNSGLISCFIRKPQDINGKYGFIFSISLLIQDFEFLKLIEKSDKYLASIFRVPEFSIQVKRSLLKKYYKEEKYEKIN